MARVSPICFSSPSTAATRVASCITIPSVISSSSRCGSSPVSARTCATTAAMSCCRNWRGDRLTATGGDGIPASRQARFWAQAVFSTQAPMVRMRPVSSASGMKVSGGTTPSSGLCQRKSASIPTTAPEERLALGW